jgi:ubiquinone/menaquinone biosynthesis C-methylase UbiE
MMRRLRTIAFHALYYQFAWAYDWVSKHFFRDQWRLWQQAALPHLKGRRVLELGPGTGVLLVELARDGYEVIGLELSPPMLRQERKRLRKYANATDRKRVLLLRGQGQAIPLADGSVDSVLSTFPSDYITAPATLTEIARVLRPDGRLVIVPSGQLLPRDNAGKLLRAVEQVAYGDGNPNTHFDVLTSNLEAAGFTMRTHTWKNQLSVAMVVVADKAGMRHEA